MELAMNTAHRNAVAMTLKEVLRPKEVGEQVVQHVLPDVKEPKPDFDAIKRILTESSPPPPGKAQADDDGNG
jgi:hypothetical protein